MKQVKICGLCRPEDAAAAARHGAYYVGVILAPNRKRSQTLESAARILDQAGAARRVGVFVDPAPAEVERAVRALGLAVVQLHGQETPELAGQIAMIAPVWKAVAVGAAGALVDAVSAFAPLVHAIVLDSGAGGSGHTFDWTQAASLHENFGAAHFVLAGGLTADNVGAAIQTLDPDVVDVSTGVEASEGVKSGALIKTFIEAAHAAFAGKS